MNHRCPFPRFVVILCVLLLVTAGRAAAIAESLAAESGEDLPPARPFQLRTEDSSLKRLIDQGMRESATFRLLVHRLNQSDVVVYLQNQASPLPGVDGRLSFLSTGGGYRYVVVRIGSLASPEREVALIGHELQHALEIADTPSIVDAETMATAYAHTIGFASRGYAHSRMRTFDSDAAVRTGEQVLREMLSAE